MFTNSIAPTIQFTVLTNTKIAKVIDLMNTKHRNTRNRWNKPVNSSLNAETPKQFI